MNDYIEVALTNTAATMKLSIEDADLASAGWFLNGRYVKTNVRRGHVAAHRLVLERQIGRRLETSEYTDHINGDRLDNRRVNLRVADYSQNIWNRRKFRSRPTLSKYIGVLFDPKSNHKPWSARIATNGHRIRLGCYETEEEAAYIYDQFAIALHGEYAVTNLL